MRKKLITAFAILLTTTSLIFCQSPASGKLIIKFTGLRNNTGQMAIGVNKNPEGWPKKPHMKYQWKKDPVKAGVFVTEINNLPYGTYAISVLDDENCNEEMDMTLGIPKEGFAFSNNPPVKLKAPDFESCSFELRKPVTEVVIDIKYMGKK